MELRERYNYRINVTDDELELESAEEVEVREERGDRKKGGEGGEGGEQGEPYILIE